MVRRKTLVLLVAVCAFLVTACTPVGDAAGDGDDTTAPQGGEVTDGGELVVALEDDPDMLDPSLARTYVGRTVFTSLCEKLYDIDAELNIIPQLAAELPEVSEDGRTVTIPIREGLTFNDGTPMDAEAVKTSLERHKSIEGSARASELELVTAIEVADPTTVELTLSEPFSPLTATLADRAGMIMSPAKLEELAEDFADDPVCVAPFSFVERVAQDRIVLEKSEHYYAADEVHLDRIVYRAIPDGNIRAANLRSGDIHVASRLDPTTIPQVQADENITLQDPLSLGYQGISVNVGNANGLPPNPPGAVEGAPASSAEVRRAFELAIDRQQLVETVFGGLYAPGCSPLPPSSQFAPPIAENCPEQDLEQARQLIADAGVPTPIPVELIIGTDPESARLGQTIQSMVAEAGFEVSLRPTEFAAALDQTDAGNYQMFQVGWSGRVDPDGNLYAFQASDGSLNITRADNPEVDRLLREARVVQDQPERTRLYEQVVELVREQANIIYLWHETWNMGIRNEVQGVEVYSDGLLRVSRAGFTSGN